MNPNEQSLIKDSLPLRRVPSPIINLLKEHFSSNRTVTIACSGGLDSIFLTLWVYTHFHIYKSQLLLLHYNHATRNHDSDDDECFVREFATKLGIRVESKKRHTNKLSSNSEGELRKARFDFFYKTLKAQNSNLLLTGHHLSDKIETLLMRLSRGSGLNGLTSPSPVKKMKNGVIHLRPLIYQDKEKMRSLLQQIGQNWKEDSSNQNIEYYRNYIRNKLLRKWSAMCPFPLIENIGTSCSLLQEDADALNNWADSVVQSISIDSKKFPMSQFITLPIAVLRRSILIWLNNHNISGNLTHDLLYNVINGKPNESFNLTTNQYLRIDEKGDIELAKQLQTFDFTSKHYQLSESSTIFFPNQLQLRLQKIEPSKKLIDEICSGNDDPNDTVHLDLDESSDQSRVRVVFWKDGMSYQPLGFKHNKKLQDCYVDRKIPKNNRKQIPVIINKEGEVLWSPGLLPSEKARVSYTTKSLLRLTYC